MPITITDVGLISRERLKELFSYDPETGVFLHLVGNRRIKRGASAVGITSRGYARVYILGRSYCAHRLAWLYVYGRWPLEELDHIDRNKLNNRIDNLREVTHYENILNRRNAGRPRKCEIILG